MTTPASMHGVLGVIADLLRHALHGTRSLPVEPVAENAQRLAVMLDDVRALREQLATQHPAIQRGPACRTRGE